jgi:tetratricopeptide (TPR) repeat protein
LLLDAQGTAWITDFGLAKAEGMEELTHSGDLVGTLRYMAPEQLRGKSDARGDVYSLGSALYELLTLRPAFDAANRADLIRQIADHEPPPPRRIDGRIPRDLETIVLTAMATDPHGRYASAGEMAADLRRFVDDKPIAARAVGRVERLWRWCLRRPALAGLGAALAVSLLVGIGGVLWQWRRAEGNFREAMRQQGIAVESLQMAQRSQQRAEQNAAEASRQQSIAERRASEADANYQTARNAVHELLTMASEDELLTQPGLQPLRVELLTRALQFYEERLADRESDPMARRDLALAYFRLGSIRQQMGPTGNEAANDYRRALALLAADENREGASGRATRILLSRIENNLALEHLKQNELDAAHAILGRTQKRLAAHLAAAPDDAEAQAVRAMTLNNVGYHRSLLPDVPLETRYEQAIRLHEEALGIYRQVAERRPEDWTIRHSIANTLSNLGRRHQALEQDAKAREFMVECSRVRKELLRLQPSSLELQASYSSSLNAIGDVIMASDLAGDEQLAQALPYYLQAFEMHERLVQENPSVPRFLEELGNLPRNIGELYEGARDLRQSLEWRRREIDVWNRCLALAAEHREAKRLRADALNKQGELEQRLELYSAALQSWREARAAWQALESSPETMAAYRKKIVLNLRQLMIELGQQSAAAEIAAVAGERRKWAGDSTIERLSLCYDVERAFRALGRGAELDGAAFRQRSEYLALAVQIFREIAAREPAEAEKFARARKSMASYVALIKLDADLNRQPDSVPRLIDRARALRQLGDDTAAQADESHALELFENLVAEDAMTAIARRRQAQLHFNAGRWQEAFEASARGLQLQPHDYLLRKVHGEAGLELKQWQAAGEDFRSILENRPEKVYYWPERLHCLAMAGRLDEAQAEADELPGLAKASGKNADYVVWHFFESGEVGRFADVALQVAADAARRHPTNTYRCELGGVQYYRGEYRAAIGNLTKAAAEDRTTPSVLAGFWLAQCHQRLGEPAFAQWAFRRAVRNWKGLAALPPDEERLLRQLWQEARSAIDPPQSLAGREFAPHAAK